MNSSKLWHLSGAVCLAALGVPGVAAAQASSTSGTPTSMVVTAEPRRGKEAPPLEAQDVVVKEGRDQRPVAVLLHCMALWN